MSSANNTHSDELIDRAIDEALASLESTDYSPPEVLDELTSEMRDTLALLSQSADYAVPGPELKARLLEGIAGDTQEKQTHVDVLTHEGEWKQLLKGVKAKVLFVEPSNGYVTTMLKLDPGASLPTHFHRGNEQCLILEGEFQMYGKVFRPGDFTVALAQTQHVGVFTATGATVLLVAPPDYERGAV